MKFPFLAIVAIVFLSGCETPVPNNVSVEKGEEFAASQGYEDLRLESRKTHRLVSKPLAKSSY